MLESLNSYRSIIGENHPLWEEKLPDRIVSLFIDRVDELEKLPVNINGTSAHENFEVDYSQWIEAVKSVIKSLKKQNKVLNEQKNEKDDIKKINVVIDKVNDNIVKLYQRLDGMRYRITEKHGGKDVSQDFLKYKKLTEKLVEWKKLPKQFNLDTFEITEKDKEKLKLLARYTSVAKRVIDDEGLRNKFFNWAIRFNGDVDLFVEFPKLAEKMTTCRVQDWVGYIDNDVIKMEVEEGIKTVQMKYQDDNGQKKVSILDEKVIIVLEKGLELSIQEIFQIHADKLRKEPGLVCLFHDGLRNWNTRQIGRWDKDRKNVHLIDVTVEKWWKQLPILKKLTRQQAKDKYGKDLGEGETIAAFALCATRAEANKVNVNGTHSYDDAILPIEGEGDYAVYSIGKEAAKYPKDKWELLDIVFKFVHGNFVIPDPNPTYKLRQSTWTSTLVKTEVVANVMKRVSNKIEQGRAEQLSFQLFCTGCTKSAEKNYNVARKGMELPEVKPFDIHFTAVDATGFLAWVIWPTKFLPKFLHNIYLHLMFYIGKPWRKTKYTWENITKEKSCWNHKIWSKKEVKSPAKLFKLQEEAKKSGQDPMDILPKGKLQPGFLEMVK